MVWIFSQVNERTSLRRRPVKQEKIKAFLTCSFVQGNRHQRFKFFDGQEFPFLRSRMELLPAVQSLEWILRNDAVTDSLVQCADENGLVMVGAALADDPVLLLGADAVLRGIEEFEESSAEIRIHLAHRYMGKSALFQILFHLLPQIRSSLQG